MEPIKVAIAGVGNLASSFVQGIVHYSETSTTDGKIKGLLHDVLAGMKAKNISVVAAFDIDESKVGKDLAEAIFASPNVARKVVEVKQTGVIVQRGETKDGLIPETREYIKESSEAPADIPVILKESGATMLICTTPSSADAVTEYYANAALQAGIAFINATPTSIASNDAWAEKFTEANIPLIGDDLQNQAGATIIHKLILEILSSRGIIIKESYSLDVGGGVDSLNTLLRQKARQTKRNIKSEAVSMSIGQPNAQIVAGTSDFVEHLENQRNTQIWIAGNYFNGAPLEIDMFMRSFDGDNGGAVLFDVVRATNVALIKESGGPMISISAFGFKNPPGGTMPPEEAERMLSNFILGNNKN
ncbi:MAG: inositol-3-phosphate synthase [Promethearchaeota archaeon]